MSDHSDSRRSSTLKSPQERKEKLRHVITRAECLQETVGDNTIQVLETCMEETDNINSESTIDEKIQNQEEVLLDSEMMNITSKVLKHCTRSLTKSMSSYNSIEFAQNLVQYVQQIPDIESETPDWSLLEAQVRKSFRRTPSYSTLLGTLVPLEKKEVAKKRKSVTKDSEAPIKRPEKIAVIDKEEEGLEQTVKVKEVITRFFKTHRKPLDVFQLILHPTDFEKTIENILHVSFLARDGRVKLVKDESGMLVVQPCNKDMMVQVKSGKSLNIQNLVNLSLGQWKKLNDTYLLQKPMIDFDEQS